DVLPALGKPTVSTLTDDRWVAVNTVIQERQGKELLPRLRDAGARGIVEYPLSKIIEGRVARAVRLAAALLCYSRLAWWGLVAPRRERAPLVVYQAAIVGEQGVVLAMRSELCGWELPGGRALPGEMGEAAVRREVLEETGISVEVLAHV